MGPLFHVILFSDQLERNMGGPSQLLRNRRVNVERGLGPQAGLSQTLGALREDTFSGKLTQRIIHSTLDIRFFFFYPRYKTFLS